MNELTPIPPSNAGFQLMEPMANGHTPPPKKFRPQKFLFFLRKFWWIPLITAILCIGVTIVILLNTPHVYISTGSLWETVKLELPDAANYAENRDSFIGTMSYVLRSDELRNRTFAWMRDNSTNQIPKSEDGNPIPVTIQLVPQPGSQVYNIQATCINQSFAKPYLDALMDQYLEFRKSSKRGVSNETLASIATEVDQEEQAFKKAQKALNDYERTNNLAALQDEVTLKSAYLVKEQTQLSEYQLDYKIITDRELELNSGSTGATNETDLLFNSINNNSSPVITTPSPRLEAQKQIAQLKAERERLSAYLLPKHPRMMQLDLDIAHAENSVEQYRQENQAEIANARKALQIKMKDIQDTIDEWTKKVAADNDLIASADEYKQEVARNQGMYEHLSSLVQSLQISTGIDTETLAVFAHATPAVRSYAAAKSKIMQSGLLGLGLGLGIVFLLMWRDDRFNSLVEVTEKFGDNVVGQVPELPATTGMESFALLAGNDERHMYAESYRNLRSALLYLSVEGRRPKLVIITSAVPNEGKSTIATNLARTLALGGAKVLLVDGDLRKGSIHEVLKVQSKPGFSDLLREPGDPCRFVQETDLPNFFFVSRGSITRNPGDLLLSPAVDQILARFREQYDYVLIDSSPMFAADDTSTIAPKADGVLFVVRSRFSHARMVREALELLFQRQAKVLGLILNRSDASVQSYYHYKYAEYYTTANMAEADKNS